MAEVKQAAETAIKLDASLSEAYCSLAIYSQFNWDWTEAKKNYIKSIELNPKYAQTHSLYGMNYLCWVEGKFDEARSMDE
jgi:Tfp pilus assembly protein PilF